MTGIRKRHQRTRAIGGGGRPPAFMLRACPKCGAGPNQSCRRETGMAEGGGTYTVRLKQPHPERRAAT